MRQTRVYTGQGLSSFEPVELGDRTAHYLTRVLRLSVGDQVTLFNGDGLDYAGEITGIQRHVVTVMLGKSRNPDNESCLDITLVQAISRGERMDYCLQKSTELGVSRIRLLNSKRVEVRLKDARLQKRMAHWQAVIISACEQSGRAQVPELIPPLSFQQWLSSADVMGHLLLDPLAKTTLSSVSTGAGAVSLLVGPEGGFSDDEVEQAKAMGVKPVSLGPRVLRTETAGPTAIAVLQTLSGDFR